MMKKAILMFQVVDLLFLSSFQKNKDIVNPDFQNIERLEAFIPYYDILPTYMHSNYMDRGEYYIGRKGSMLKGKERGDMLVPLKRNSNLAFAIRFKEDPYDFPNNEQYLALGYKLVLVDLDGSEIIHQRYKRVDKLRDLFSAYSYDCEHFDKWEDDYVMILDQYCKSIVVRFPLYKGQLIRDFSFLYGDLPQEVERASLIEFWEPLSETLNQQFPEECYIDEYDDTYEYDSKTDLKTYHFKSEYGSYYSIDYIRNLFICKDDRGKRLDIQIIDEDRYFKIGNKAKIGTSFDVYLLSEDNRGNKEEIKLIFTVVDEKAPNIIPINKDIKASYKTDLSDRSFIEENFAIADNSLQDVKYEIRDDSNKVVSTLPLGMHDLKLYVEDIYQNNRYYPFSVEIIDDISPIINCRVDEINLSTDIRYSIDDLTSFFYCEDEIDGKISLEVVLDEYSGNEDVEGDYRFIIEGKDGYDNKSQRALNIIVRGYNKPVFYTKSTFITVLYGMMPSFDQLVSSFIRQEILPDKNYIGYEVLSGEGIKDDLDIGLHNMTISFLADDETEEILDLTIDVVTRSEMMLEKESKENFFDKIVSFLKSIFDKVIDFFKSLFHIN